MNTVCPRFLHFQFVNNKQRCSGVLVENTITKANTHFGPDCDNEAKSTHGLYENPNTLVKFIGFTAEHSVYAWSLGLREEHRPRVPENRDLREQK
jgi:hypothetical protein